MPSHFFSIFLALCLPKDHWLNANRQRGWKLPSRINPIKESRHRIALPCVWNLRAWFEPGAVQTQRGVIDAELLSKNGCVLQ
jgi:hypothetical protein